MNSPERVFAALELKEPDQVPIMESVVDKRIRQAIYPDTVESGAFSVRIGLDTVSSGLEFRRHDETPDSHYDEWGVFYRISPEEMFHPVKGPVETMADLQSWSPPDPEAPWRLGALPELIERYKGEKAIVLHHRAAFMWAAYVANLDHLLLSFAIDPELAHALMDKVLEANIAMVRRAIRAGVEIVTLGDDYAHNFGPMMSPAHFRTFIFPRLKRMIDVIREEGAYCIKHSDGNLWPILDMIIEAGPHAINPIEPVAGMDIAEVKRKHGHQVCLVGNIDCGELLSHGTTEEVEQAVRCCIRDAGQGGGFILSSSNSIHSSVKPENFATMVLAGQKYGKYPLELEEPPLP
ncbi:MAG: uroporphyrinogen decarboxylase family protein [Lentisphaeria bacterium]|jgi:uroporphyrinogen decarboxylase|nr:uroporphyrinogen decarboxylase family protein [Lentisphaeria bacterium]